MKQPTEVPQEQKLEQPKEESKEEPKKTVVTDFKSTEMPVDYEIEDVSIVHDMTQSEIEQELPVGTVTNLEIGDKIVKDEPVQNTVVSDDLKIETPKPVIEKPLSPEEVYKLQSQAENGFMEKALMQLFELGFQEFNRNKELLTKFNYNIEAVASALIEDMELYD